MKTQLQLRLAPDSPKVTRSTCGEQHLLFNDCPKFENYAGIQIARERDGIINNLS